MESFTQETLHLFEKKFFESRKTNLRFWHSNYFSLGKFLNFSGSRFSCL